MFWCVGSLSPKQTFADFTDSAAHAEALITALNHIASSRRNSNSDWSSSEDETEALEQDDGCWYVLSSWILHIYPVIYFIIWCFCS